MPESIKIKKVKLSGEALDVIFIKADKTKCSEEHKNPVHPDLKKAVKDLAFHFACISYFMDPSDLDSPEDANKELLEYFHVHGYNIGGDEEDPGIIITGHKILPNGKALNMNTPFTRLAEKPETAYKFTESLLAKITVIESEVLKYLYEGKVAADPQGSLFPEENVTSAQVLSPETEEDRNQETLNKLKGKDMASVYANPDAMKRVNDWGGKNGTHENGEMIEAERNKLRGKGSRKKAGAKV